MKNSLNNSHCEKLKQAVLDGKTTMYSRPLMEEEKLLFKQKIMNL